MVEKGYNGEKEMPMTAILFFKNAVKIISDHGFIGRRIVCECGEDILRNGNIEYSNM